MSNNSFPFPRFREILVERKAALEVWSLSQVRDGVVDDDIDSELPQILYWAPFRRGLINFKHFWGDLLERELIWGGGGLI